jgi:Spy/CpxP family protein refolding chaperone
MRSETKRRLPTLKNIDNEFEALAEINRALSADEIDEKFAETLSNLQMKKLQARETLEMKKQLADIKKVLGIE